MTSRSPRPSTSTEPGQGLSPGPALAELREALARLRQPALEIYAAHDLPLEPGFYIRSDRAKRWRRLPDELTAAERMEMVLQDRGRSPLRLARMEELGGRVAGADAADLHEASRLLTSLRRLEDRLDRGDAEFVTDLRLALGVGAQSQALARGLTAKAASGRLALKPARRRS